MQIVYKDLHVDDPKKRQPDITKARAILGWEPNVERAEGLQKTYDYFKALPPHLSGQNCLKNLCQKF